MLHHSTLREDQQPFGSSRSPTAKKMIDFYTFDVGKVLHHSTLPPLVHSPKARRPSRREAWGTTSKPGGDVHKVNKPVQTLAAEELVTHQLHHPLLVQAQDR
jgi:hypothetical protein